MRAPEPELVINLAFIVQKLSNVFDSASSQTQHAGITLI
jgi:hypothetical protein